MSMPVAASTSPSTVTVAVPPLFSTAMPVPSALTAGVSALPSVPEASEPVVSVGVAAFSVWTPEPAAVSPAPVASPSAAAISPDASSLPTVTVAIPPSLTDTWIPVDPSPDALTLPALTVAVPLEADASAPTDQSPVTLRASALTVALPPSANADTPLDSSPDALTLPALTSVCPPLEADASTPVPPTGSSDEPTLTLTVIAPESSFVKGTSCSFADPCPSSSKLTS